MLTATATRTRRSSRPRMTRRAFHAVVAAVLAESLACGRARAALQEWGAQPRMIEAMELQSGRRVLKLLAAAGLDLDRYSVLLGRYGTGIAAPSMAGAA